MYDLILSMRQWSKAGRNGFLWGAFMAVAVLSGALTWWLRDAFNIPDSYQYLAMANRQRDLIMLPFASRQLGVLIVQALSSLLHLSIEQSFVVEGGLCFVVFLGVVLYLLGRSSVPWWMIPAVVGMAFWPLQLDDLVLPDLLYAALLCGFLLLLWRSHLMMAALMLFPLMVARESTMLTIVCLLIAGRRRLHIREMVVAVLATGAGMLVVRHLTADAMPNKEHISPLFYLAAKMPWNLMKNVLGLNLWANVYQSCAVPKWQMPVHLGPLHAIGLCSVNFEGALSALALALASFGLLPLLLFKLRRACDGLDDRPDKGIFLRFCILYGGVSFLLTPLLGVSFLRLYFYGWPLFLVALPILMAEAKTSFRSNGAAVLFLAMHLTLSWTTFHINDWTVFVVALITYPVGGFLLWQV